MRGAKSCSDKVGDDGVGDEEAGFGNADVAVGKEDKVAAGKIVVQGRRDGVSSEV